MRTVFATRRQFLVAAGTGLLAPGCLGGGGPDTAPRAQPSAPPRLVGPIHAAVPAGSVDPADAADFTSTRGARVSLIEHRGGPDLSRLVAAGGVDAVLARQDDIAALAAQGLLAPLDHSLVPNLADASPALLDLPYDPGQPLLSPGPPRRVRLRLPPRHGDRRARLVGGLLRPPAALLAARHRPSAGPRPSRSRPRSRRAGPTSTPTTPTISTPLARSSSGRSRT